MGTEYHKIETLFVRDERTHKLKEPLELKDPIYDLIKTWEWTEKIDGTNIRCHWDPAAERVTFGGKTDNAQIPAKLVAWLNENVTAERLYKVFPDSPVVVYGEGYGAGIQKGGIYSPTQKLIVFDVLVDNRWWLNWRNTKDVAAKLGLDVVPFCGEMSLDDACDWVRKGFTTAIIDGTGGPAEGLVGRTREPLFDKKGDRLIVKLKTKDFAS
jgi:hypothetical protein